MKLIDTFVKGDIPDFPGPLKKTIETFISKLFFSTDTVVKVYKNQKYFFADLKTLNTRRQFFEEDFRWNNKMSPNISQRLQGMEQQGGVWRKTSLSSADDFYIKMKRIDDTKNLTNLLLSKKATPRQLVAMATEMIAKLNELSDEQKIHLNKLRKKWSLREFQELDLNDSKLWAHSASPALPKSRTNAIIFKLKRAHKLIPYFQNLNMSDLIFAIDSQSDNILILNNEIEFLDIMPPKESWRIQDLFFTIARPATDVSVLVGPAKARIIYQTYAQHLPLPPPAVRTVYEIKSALIKTAYMHILNQPKTAQKYLSYIDKLLPTLPQQ